MLRSVGIHPSAIISHKATISKNALVGPFCVIEDGVEIGERVTIEPHVVIKGNTAIGTGSSIFSFSCVGGMPQDKKYCGEYSALKIGKNCTIREHVTINSGTKKGNGETIIGDGCLIMASSHIGHDCVLANKVVVSTGVSIAGHVKVGEGAIIGGNAAIKQHMNIGQFSMVGGMTGVVSDVIPYGLVAGDRAHLLVLHHCALTCKGIESDRSEKNEATQFRNTVNDERKSDIINEVISKAFQFIFNASHISEEHLFPENTLLGRARQLQRSLDQSSALEAGKSRIQEILEFILRVDRADRPLATTFAHSK